MRKEVVEFVCDVCGKTEAEGADGIATRTVVVDGIGAEGEVCADDWAGILAGLAVFATNGRPLPAKTRTRAKPWPGTTWRFSSHALIRLGERNLDPLEILPVLDDPTTTRPGRASDLVIHERGQLKAVVAPERGVVITVARRTEDDE